MAVPLSADKMLKALRAEDVKVSERSGWRTHSRNHKGKWGPVHGVMIHHTVSSGDDASVALCYNGHSALPGPLCHGVGRNDGTVALVSAGRANHAGLGDDDVLRAVIAETSLPAPNEANTDGNARFYGLEIINLGDNKDTYTRAQYRAAVLWAAALCRAHGWSERSVIGHKEWQPGKVDPRGPIEGGGSFSMTQFRADVRDQLARKPGAPATTNPTTPPKEKDEMTPAQEALLKQVAADLGSVKKDVAELKKNSALAPWTYKNAALVAEAKKTGGKVPDMHGRVQHIEQMLEALTKEN